MSDVRPFALPSFEDDVRAQEEIGKQVESLADNKQKTLTDSGPNKEIAEQIQQQRSSLTNLLDSMRGVSDKAEAVEPLLARQLYDTLRKSAQGQADNSLNMSSVIADRFVRPHSRGSSFS